MTWATLSLTALSAAPPLRMGQCDSCPNDPLSMLVVVPVLTTRYI